MTVYACICTYMHVYAGICIDPYHLLYIKRLHLPPRVGHNVCAIESLSLSLICCFVV